MLTKSKVFAINGTPIYTPDAPLPFAFGHLQGNAGRSLSGYTVKNTVRFGVRSFENVHYSNMTLAEYAEMHAIFMQPAEYFWFTFYDTSLNAVNTVQVYCNNCSGDLISTDGEGLVSNVTFTLVER